MNRAWIVLAVFLVLLSCASASVTLVSPVSKAIAANGVLSIGGVMAGQTFEIVVSNSDGQGGVWNRLTVVPESLPASWKIVKAESFAESLTVQVQVPKEETEKTVRLRLQLSDFGNSLRTQEVSLEVAVKNDLVKLDLIPLQKSVLAGQTVSFRLIAINDSIGEQPVLVRSDMPIFWFEPVSFSLGPTFRSDSHQEHVLTVFPRSYGSRDFSIWVDSALTNKNLESFSDSLTVYPTIESKFQSSLFGWPVFSPTLSVYYFFNGLLGSLQ